jgi:hypothetical protein
MTSVLIVEQDSNPSTDFFVLPELERGHYRCERHRLSDTLPDDARKIDCIVFVRYITPQWRCWVDKNRAQLGKVVLFMDDDLLDLNAHAGLPLRYRWKLWQLIWRHQGWLKKIGAQLWVSTPYLAEKYAGWKPVLLEPKATSTQVEPVKTLFYHGSASHYDEIQWLYPVVAEVLAHAPELTFEIIGNQKVRKLFANLPRVHVLHSMKWPAYQALLRRPGRTIGLAPLLDSPFNRARSHTKFFDITQAGAVGIYAPGTIYERIVKHGDNGLLVPMEKDAWVEAILQLAGDEAYRARLLQGARNSL